MTKRNLLWTAVLAGTLLVLGQACGDDDTSTPAEGEGEGEGGTEGEGEGEGGTEGEGEGEGEGEASICAAATCDTPPDPAQPKGDCGQAPPLSEGAIDVCGVVVNMATGAPVGAADRVKATLATPGVLGCAEALHGIAPLCDGGQFSFADAGVACLTGLTADDMDCDDTDTWVATFTPVHMLGTNAGSAESKAGVIAPIIATATMDAWTTAARTLKADDTIELLPSALAENEAGCLVIKIADAAGSPVVGAELTTGMPAMPHPGAYYFNETMTGFQADNKTSASGWVIVPKASTGSYCAQDEAGTTWSPELAQGGSLGVCVVGALLAQE